MNLGRELVASALREHTLRPFTEAGINREFLDDPAAAAVFTDNDRAAYRHLLDHWASHKKTPSLDMFRLSFPEGTYRLPKSDYTVDELLGLFDEDFTRYTSQLASMDIADAVEAGDYDNAVEVMLSQARKIRNSRVSKNVHLRWDDPATDIEAKIARTVAEGIFTGIPEIDSEFPGFQPGNLITYLGRAKSGKSLSLETPLPTPTGWTTMGEVQVGDWLISRNGTPTRVTYVTPVQHNRECFEVRFRSGETIVADADHNWVTQRQEPSSTVRTEGVRTTREIRDTLTIRDRTRHRIAVAAPLRLPEVSLPLDPYLLGFWLGDGTKGYPLFTVNNEEHDEFARRVKQAGFTVKSDVINSPGSQTVRISSEGPGNDFLSKLREAGVLNRKHIPVAYLRASHEQRLALLQGLMDSDGYMSKQYDAEFCSVLPELADGVYELMHTLGLRVRKTASPAKLYGRVTGTRYRLFITPGDLPVFSSPRKLSEGVARSRGTKSQYRYVSEVRPVASVPVKCITVDSADHTYLAGREMIPTHNTSHALLSALDAWRRDKRVLFLTVEITADGVSDRLDAFGAQISYADYSRGTLTHPDKAALRLFRSELEGTDQNFIVVQPQSKYTLTDLEYDIDRYEPEVVVVDGFYFLIDRVTGKPGGSWEGHDNLARELKDIALRNSITVLTTMQVREKQLGTKRGQGIDDGAIMGGTGLIMASDMVLGFDADEHGLHTVNCTRSRTGYLRTVRGRWDWNRCRFTVTEIPGSSTPAGSQTTFAYTGVNSD